MLIKAVLFDLDDTLIDFMKMKKKACKAAISGMINAGLKIDKETGFDKLFNVYMKVGIESDTAFSKFLKKETGRVDMKILESGIKAYLKKKSKYLKPYPYVMNTLKELKKKGLKLGIVTDASRKKAYQRLDAMNITKFFDVIITFDDSGCKKSELSPLKLAMKELSLKPNQVLFVGDSLERDIKPARKLGMKTFLIKNYEDIKTILLHEILS